MYTTYISTKSVSDNSRQLLTKLQYRLTIAQEEMTSGRYADVRLELGSRVGRTVALRQQIGELNGITDTNATVSTRLDSMLATLKNVTETAQKFTSTLIASRNTTTGPRSAMNEAQANLVSLIDNLNSSVGGEYLFAGINNGVEPVKAYYSSPTSDAKQAVADAFVAAFGSSQDDTATVEVITESSMQTFLASDGTFDQLFQLYDEDTDTGRWDELWSTASDDNMKSRISTSETIETTSTANNEGFRKLTKAYTMVADLGADNLNQGAYRAVVDTALSLVGEAVQLLAVEQSRLGTAQSRVESANSRMAQQVSVITDQINAMETVDPNEASTRVTTLMTQMEMAYSLTARIQKLSILNYL